MATLAAVDTPPKLAAGVLSAARAERRAADAAEARLLCLAVEWAVMHPADSIHEPASHTLRGFGQTDLALAGPGAPTVAEYAVPELAAALGLSTEAGKRYLGQALELRYRLPRLWARVQAGDLAAWRARRVAAETIGLTAEAAGFVDTHLAPVAHRVAPAQLDRLVAEAIGRHMPDEVERLAQASWDKRHVTVFEQMVSFTGTMHVEADLDIADALDLDTAVAAGAERRAALGSTESLDVRRARAVGDLARAQLTLDLNPPSAVGGHKTRVRSRQVVLHVHLSESAVRGGGDPVARLERGEALVSVEQVRSWCGHPDTQVVVKPVIDLTGCTWSRAGAGLDAETVPDRVAEQVAVRDRTCVFPWCTRPARSCDTDHAHPRSRGGPTCSCNLAPLCRRHHRLKTHSPWSYLVLDPGRYVWTTPHGYQFLRDHTGTHDISPDRPRNGLAPSPEPGPLEPWAPRPRHPAPPRPGHRHAQTTSVPAAGGTTVS